MDPGSYVSWDSPPRHPVHDTGYSEALEAARQRSGKDEAVLTGAGTIDGKAVVIIAGEFAFLAGSIGLATASRIIGGALERATLEGLPVVASPSSGGGPACKKEHPLSWPWRLLPPLWKAISLPAIPTSCTSGTPPQAGGPWRHGGVRWAT